MSSNKLQRHTLEVPMIGFFRGDVFVYAQTERAADATDHEEDLVRVPLTVRLTQEPGTAHKDDNIRLLPVDYNETILRVV